jgi:hypothetical protein
MNVEDEISLRLIIEQHVKRLNAELVKAHEAGLRPQIRNMPVMHRDEAMAQLFIFMGQGE